MRETPAPRDPAPDGDQRVTAWAKELRQAGLEGNLDQLRARAYLDILLGTDSRPLGGSPDRTSALETGQAATSAPAGPLAGVIPPGFAGRATLTIPATTLLDLAGRPGELAGIGPIDPNPGANTCDCYRSQERADPARAAHPPRPDLPHLPTPGPRCQARSKPAGGGNEGPGVRPPSTRFFPMARHSAQLAVRDMRDRGAAARE